MPEPDDPNKPRPSGQPDDTTDTSGTPVDGPTDADATAEPGERFPTANTRPKPAGAGAGGRPSFGKSAVQDRHGIDKYLPSRRSKFVAAGVVTALVGGGIYAVAAAATKDDNQRASDNRRCVDDNNVVVNDNECRTGGGGHYYYGGFGGFIPGSVVSGGSSTPRTDTVTRGGFGSGSSTKGTSSGS